MQFPLKDKNEWTLYNNKYASLEFLLIVETMRALIMLLQQNERQSNITTKWREKKNSIQTKQQRSQIAQMNFSFNVPNWQMTCIPMVEKERKIKNNGNLHEVDDAGVLWKCISLHK